MKGDTKKQTGGEGLEWYSDPGQLLDEVRQTGGHWAHASGECRFVPGTLLTDRYRIVVQLGHGGMGEVYRAEDLKLGVPVALKFLPAARSRDSGWLQLLFEEVRVAREIGHPNVCRVYDVGDINGEHFISMEYVDGEDLAALLRRIGQLPEAKAIDIARQLCAGLAAIHDKGVLHRDLKPSNIMLDGSGNVRITDFGIAAPIDQLDEKDIRAGSPAYMAPEQFTGREISTRTDIYCLGLVLYELFTGRTAVDATSVTEIERLHEAGGPVIESDLLAGAGPVVGRIVLDCLHRDPQQRPPSVGAVAEALPAPGAGTESGARESQPGSPPPGPSIAVLPFADLSPGKDQGYFCEGMAEEIISSLSRIKGLHVASRTSSLQFRDAAVDIRRIGEQLDVTTILEGSVRKAGNQLRVTAQLISASDGYHLWSERYDRPMEDVFAIQDEIARSIARALEVTLGPGDQHAMQAAPTADVQAYDCYLRGRQFANRFGKRNLLYARTMFRRAIEIDPEYALAWAGLADCCSTLYMYFEVIEENRRQAVEASLKAFELAPQLAETHVAHGLALWLNGQFDESRVSFETALQLDPKLFEAYYVYARSCFKQGMLVEAAALFEKASAVRPEDYQALLLLPHIYMGLGRKAEAVEACRSGLEVAKRTLELNPDDARALYLGAGANIWLGERETGLDWIRRALEIDPDDPAILYNSACCYSRAGEIERAIDCLERSRRVEYPRADWIENDSDMDPLRDHPRFRALMRRPQEQEGG
jgi:serine/threonine protein kinase/Tfp pilus assembly protein PilF